MNRPKRKYEASNRENSGRSNKKKQAASQLDLQSARITSSGKRLVPCVRQQHHNKLSLSLLLVVLPLLCLAYSFPALKVSRLLVL